MGIENRGFGTATRAGKTRFLSLYRVEDWSKEPATRLEYLELARQLGSQQAANYLEKGSGRFESIRKRDVFEGQANDILQTIDIRVMVEEDNAYREALYYIIQLLEEGFPKGYKLTLKSKVKIIFLLKGSKIKASSIFRQLPTISKSFPFISGLCPARYGGICLVPGC